MLRRVSRAISTGGSDLPSGCRNGYPKADGENLFWNPGDTMTGYK